MFAKENCVSLYSDMIITFIFCTTSLFILRSARMFCLYCQFYLLNIIQEIS